jgi:hypothetical protein
MRLAPANSRLAAKTAGGQLGSSAIRAAQKAQRSARKRRKLRALMSHFAMRAPPTRRTRWTTKVALAYLGRR